MSTKNKYTLQHIKLNILKFMKKVNDKQLYPNFWLIVDRADFKPLKKSVKKNKQIIKNNIHSLKEVSDVIIKKKTEYYKNKRFGEIKIKFNNNIIEKCDDIKNYKHNKTKPIISLSITIYPTDEEGKISLMKRKELRVNYFIDDMRNMVFKMKNIEVITRLLADGAVCKNESFLEISYSELCLKKK